MLLTAHVSVIGFTLWSPDTKFPSRANNLWSIAIRIVSWPLYRDTYRIVRWAYRCRPIQHAFSKPCLVNLISKDVNLVLYLSVYNGKFWSRLQKRFQFTGNLQITAGLIITQRCWCHTYLNFLCTMSHNDNGRLWAEVPALPISKSFFYWLSGWRLALSKVPTFNWSLLSLEYKTHTSPGIKTNIFFSVASWAPKVSNSGAQPKS